MSFWANERVTELQSAVAELTGVFTKPLVEVGGGSNSRIYRVVTKESVYALKQYWNLDEVTRDRLGTERHALVFMRKHGVTCVPVPVAFNSSKGLSLCEWIDGETVDDPNDDDLTAVLDFVRTLHNLRDADGASELPLATESCLSLVELIFQIKNRLNSLAEIAQADSPLDDLIRTSIVPCFEAFTASARVGYSRTGLDAESELEPMNRTLSPADLGFHNTRREPGGRLIFFDFEYFGWDDPVKLATEFLLHPGMSLREEHKDRFVEEVMEIFRDDSKFVTRMHLLFPLYGLRWSLIVLNQFLPQRRAHETELHGQLGCEAILEKQLGKAKTLIDIAQRGTVSFPYGC